MWNGLFTKHGLQLNLEKTEVLHIGHQREELDIELEGKKLTQRDSFVYIPSKHFTSGPHVATSGHKRLQVATGIHVACHLNAM